MASAEPATVTAPPATKGEPKPMQQETFNALVELVSTLTLQDQENLLRVLLCWALARDPDDDRAIADEDGLVVGYVVPIHRRVEIEGLSAEARALSERISTDEKMGVERSSGDPLETLRKARQASQQAQK